jgi:hypothetical protein
VGSTLRLVTSKFVWSVASRSSLALHVPSASSAPSPPFSHTNTTTRSRYSISSTQRHCPSHLLLSSTPFLCLCRHRRRKASVIPTTRQRYLFTDLVLPKAFVPRDSVCAASSNLLARTVSRTVLQQHPSHPALYVDLHRPPFVVAPLTIIRSRSISEGTVQFATQHQALAIVLFEITSSRPNSPKIDLLHDPREAAIRAHILRDKLFEITRFGQPIAPANTPHKAS